MQQTFSTYDTNKVIKHSQITKLINRLGIDCKQAVKHIQSKQPGLFASKVYSDNYDFENLFLN
jgi:hypothetical protein